VRGLLELGLVILGSSAAVPTKSRGLPSIAVVYRGSIILLDAGEGTQAALTRAGLSPLKVEAVLVTHLHGDHFFGLPGLLQSMGMLGRKSLLLVAGPRGLYSFLREAFKVSRWLPGYPLYIAELGAGERLSLPSGWTVETFPTCHTVESLGYRLVEPPRKPKLNMELLRRLGLRPGPYLSKLREGEPVEVNGVLLKPEDVFIQQPRTTIVYTGDTRPCKTVVEAARNATVLVHDATFTSDMAEEAYEQGHSTAADAAKAAAEAGAELLVLFHISARYEDPTPLLNEARRYHHNTIVAEDTLKIVIRP
jgi:ribonuclease Z